MAGAEVKHLAHAAMPATTAAEHFTPGEPANKDQLIGFWNTEVFAIHFLGRQLPVIRQALGNRMAGVYAPQPLFVVGLTPAQ